MLNKKVEEILNVQIEKEGYSSNLYLAMSSWAEANGYEGIAKWLFAQSEEEREHMLKIMSYINDRGGNALVPAFAKPPFIYEGVKTLFEQVLEHEKYVTESINEIVAVCIEEKDYATHNWIQWFVSEQVEEEASAGNILDKINLLDNGPLYIFDRDIMNLRG